MKVKKKSLYDCFNAKVVDGYISCAKGHDIGMIKSYRIAIGRPLILNICQGCSDFDEMDGGPVLPQFKGWSRE